MRWRPPEFSAQNDRTSELPGPGEYSPEQVKSPRRAPTFGASRRPLSSVEMIRVPGPGTYNPVDDEHGPSFSLRSRWNARDPGRNSPGPAEYSPKYEDSFGSRSGRTVSGFGPKSVPASQNLAKTRSACSPARLRSQVAAVRVLGLRAHENAVVGPGSYSPAPPSTLHGISLGSRHPDPFDRARVSTPSPATYSAPVDRFFGGFCGGIVSAAGRTIGERFPGPGVREAARGAGPGSEPGPATFSPRRNKDTRVGVKFGGGKRLPASDVEVGARSPGPAAYDLRREKEDRYAIFSR